MPNIYTSYANGSTIACMATKKTVKKTVRLTQEWTPDQIAKIDKLCEKTSLNRTAVIKLAAAEMAERRGV